MADSLSPFASNTSTGGGNRPADHVNSRSHEGEGLVASPASNLAASKEKFPRMKLISLNVGPDSIVQGVEEGKLCK